MSAFTIHKNAPVNQPLYMLDRDGNPIDIDPGATFIGDIKKYKEDADPLVRFATGGGAGIGEIAIVRDTLDDGRTAADFLVFTADKALVGMIEPGAYVADVLRVDDPDWTLAFPVIVDEGVTDGGVDPPFSGTFVIGGVQITIERGWITDVV